jgi:HK97 family phage portal protein
VGRIRDFLTGADLVSRNGHESRTFAVDPLIYPRSPLLNVTEGNALRVADAYACVRVLADAVASLPPKVYRRTPQGRVPAGDDQRLVQLLRQPSPGSTSADLFSQIVVHLNVHGNAYVGKFRSDRTIVSLGLLDPNAVQVELQGQRIVYTVTVNGRQSEHGPADMLHVKGMSADGLRGLSPVAQCRLALSLSANLQEHAKRYFEQGAKPTGILSLPESAKPETVKEWRERRWTALERRSAALP